MPLYRIETRSGECLLNNLELIQSSTVSDLKHLIHQKVKRLSPERQRLSLGQRLLQPDNATLSQFTENNEKIITIQVKDLGPQIQWKTVFLLEYLGPIVIHSLFYLFQSQPNEKVRLHQFICYLCIVAHYLKREYETLFIHRFSHSTMPFFNLFKNCFHYYVLGGLMIAYRLYRSDYNVPSYLNENLMNICVVLFVLAELLNFHAHYTLRQLRSDANPTARQIPHGFGFEWVSCPNYLWETVAWSSMAILMGDWSGWIFLFVSTGQMLVWAQKKHALYRKEFKNYPRQRKAMIPFIF